MPTAYEACYFPTKLVFAEKRRSKNNLCITEVIIFLRILYIFIFGSFPLVFSQNIFDIPFITSALYFSICWLFLFFCAYWYGQIFLPRFIALWVLIDLGILLQMLSFEHHAGHGSLSGVEFLWLVSYAPIIVPSGFLSILMTEFCNAPIKIFIEWGGSYYFQILSNWISF